MGSQPKRCLSAASIQQNLGSPGTAIWQEKEIRGPQIEKEEMKSSCISKTIKITLMHRINKYSKAAGHKIDTQKSVAFLYPNDKLSKQEIKTIIPFTIITTTTTLRYSE